MEEIRVAGRPGERINEYIRSFGQDDEGELYVLTSDVGRTHRRYGKDLQDGSTCKIDTKQMLSG